MGIDKEKILEIAQRYTLRGQSKKAIKELEKLVESSPQDSRLRIKLGDLYLKNGKEETAFNEYLKVAELYEEEDLNVRAISIYKKILSTNPNFIEALHKIAKLYLKEGLEGSAKNSYLTILKISPDDPEALSALEGITDRQPSKEGLAEAAPRHFPFLQKRPSREPLPAASPPPRSMMPSEKWIDTRQDGVYGKQGMGTTPDYSLPGPGGLSVPPGEVEEPPPPPVSDKDRQDAEMHYHLGIAYREMDLFDYAITEFEMASESPSIRFDCCIMLGTCYMERGDYDKSIEYYKKASGIRGLSNEKMARLHFNLGLAYEAHGMIPEALDAFRLAIRLDHSFSDAQEKIEKLQTPSQ